MKKIGSKYIEVWSCFEVFAEIKAMVQSDFGFDARLKSYRFFSLAPWCFNHSELLVGLFGLATARPGYTKRKVE
jgi:hypothetical protein